MIARLNIFIVLPMVVLILPWMGLVAIHLDPQAYAWILDGWPYSPQPLVMYSAFLATFLFTLLALTVLSAPLLLRSDGRKVRSRNGGQVGISLVLISLSFFIVFTLNVNPFEVLRGVLSKSEIRQTSPLTAVTVKYVLPSLFAYGCLAYRAHRISIYALCIVFTLAFFGGLSLGGKTSAIISILPGAAALYFNGMRWSTAIVVGVLAILIATTSGLHFDKHLRDGGMSEAARYLARRAFILTAQVPYQITQQSLSGREFDYTSTLGSAATDSLLLLHIDLDDLYRYNFAKAVTARLYPEQRSRVNSGRWNVTPTVFTEGFLAFGFAFYWYFAALAATLVWLFNTMINIAIRNGLLPVAAVLMGYYVFVFNAWINSGGVGNLIHPLPILSYSCTLVFLLIIDRHPLKANSVND